jgi:hypothetical protein
MERLLFPYYVYDEVRSSLYPKKIETALVVSMNRTRRTRRSSTLTRSSERWRDF